MRCLADHGRAIGSPAVLREARDVLLEVVGCSRAMVRAGDLGGGPRRPTSHRQKERLGFLMTPP